MGGSVGSEDGDAGFQIAPMVDVVFVLLLFFMASAGSQIVERELNISLPGLDQNSAQALVDAAHQVCPYSNATRGNIDVTITLV